jgi:hypothetical protein
VDEFFDNIAKTQKIEETKHLRRKRTTTLDFMNLQNIFNLPGVDDEEKKIFDQNAKFWDWSPGYNQNRKTPLPMIQELSPENKSYCEDIAQESILLSLNSNPNIISRSSPRHNFSQGQSPSFKNVAEEESQKGNLLNRQPMGPKNIPDFELKVFKFKESKKNEGNGWQELEMMSEDLGGQQEDEKIDQRINSHRLPKSRTTKLSNNK